MLTVDYIRAEYVEFSECFPLCAFILPTSFLHPISYILYPTSYIPQYPTGPASKGMRRRIQKNPISPNIRNSNSDDICVHFIVTLLKYYCLSDVTLSCYTCVMLVLRLCCACVMLMLRLCYASMCCACVTLVLLSCYTCVMLALF
jgi:hypothetical protein